MRKKKPPRKIVTPKKRNEDMLMEVLMLIAKLEMRISELERGSYDVSNEILALREKVSKVIISERGKDLSSIES